MVHHVDGHADGIGDFESTVGGVYAMASTLGTMYVRTRTRGVLDLVTVSGQLRSPRFESPDFGRVMVSV